jgi:hypothetical protein
MRRLQIFAAILAVILASCNSTAPANPVLLSSGSFYDVVHKGSGRAALYALPDGSRVLKLENFSVESGPVLEVWLSGAVLPKDNASVSGNAYLSLGNLKSAMGPQEYPIPASANLTDFKSVVIWCSAFSVNFISAGLN